MSQLGLADLGMVAANARRDRLGGSRRRSTERRWRRCSLVPQPGGRPPYEALAMFRALLFAQRHDLSGPALEDAIAYNLRRAADLAA
jgi:Transposase domain (DUF772)